MRQGRVQEEDQLIDAPLAMRYPLLEYTSMEMGVDGDREGVMIFPIVIICRLLLLIFVIVTALLLLLQM